MEMEIPSVHTIVPAQPFPRSASPDLDDVLAGRLMLNQLYRLEGVPGDGETLAADAVPRELIYYNRIAHYA